MKYILFLTMIAFSSSTLAQIRLPAYKAPKVEGSSGSGSCCTGEPHCASISTQNACTGEGCSWKCAPEGGGGDKCTSKGGQWCSNPPPGPGETGECVFASPLAVFQSQTSGSTCTSPLGGGTVMSYCNAGVPGSPLCFHAIGP